MNNSSEVRLLTFVGMTGSGKGTCTEYLVSKGYPMIYFGGMVYEEVASRGLDIVKDEAFVREDMRAKEGKAVLAKRVAVHADELIASGKTSVVLDGLYSWSEYRYLFEKYGDSLIIIAVVAPKATRHKRAVERVDTRRKYTLEQVQTRDFQEIENLEKGGPIAIADYYLLNNGTKKELLAQLDGLLLDLS